MSASPSSTVKESEEDSSETSTALEISKSGEKSEPVATADDEEEVPPMAADPMEEDPVDPATVFCIRLKQPRTNLQHKMSVPELCRNFR